VATDNNFIYEVFADNSLEATSTSPVTLSYGTRYYWRVRAVNDAGAGNWSSVWSFSIKTTVAKIVGLEINAGAPYTNSTSVTINLSGEYAVEISFSNDGIVWGDWQPFTESVSYTLPEGDGIKTVYIRARDETGDIGQTFSCSITLDQTAPTTTHSLSGDLDPQGYRNVVVITLTSDDATAGVETVEYRINRGEWETGNTFEIKTEGTHTVEYRSTDKAGNVEKTKSFEVTVYAPTALPPILIHYWWAILAAVVTVGATSTFVIRRARLVGKLERIKKEKRRVVKLMKEAEIKYYREGSITRDTFDELMRGYEKRAADLDEEERALKARVKKVKRRRIRKKERAKRKIARRKRGKIAKRRRR
jgi:hypothetical protein